VKRSSETLTLEGIGLVYRARRKEIKARLAEFAAVRNMGCDDRLWEEMVFCFFTGGCSARMGLNAVNAVRPLLKNGTQEQLAAALSGVHRYPNARSRYIVASRNFLREHCNLEIGKKLHGFRDHHERRDWLVKEKGIKGLGYKEASHFLRNIGFKGYAILDKHILACLAELKIIDEPKPPKTRAAYLTTEEKLKHLTRALSIDFDELDLVLWSMKTGVILK